MRDPFLMLDFLKNQIGANIAHNRGLTKVIYDKTIKNSDEFTKDGLIITKGPYLEYVPQPLEQDISFKDFANEIGLERNLTKSIIRALFNGNEEGKLYKHQSEFIKNALKNNKDLVISVPTASGKTESFLIPILNYCIKNKDDGVKALLLYPTKTLGVDQTSRFIVYLKHLNDHLRNKITIGVWDGSTPYRVSENGNHDNSVSPNSPIRGLICPCCSKKLYIRQNETVYCERCGDFSWIKMTRNSMMKSGVDIFITNPEALDYLLVDPNDSKKSLIGKRPLKAPLRYLVLDEAHVWRGVSGSALTLLIKRLRYLYGSKMQILLSSATISDPKKLLRKLTSSDGTFVKFYPKSYKISSNEIDFHRISPADLEESFKFYFNNNGEAIRRNDTDINDIIRFLRLFDLVESKNDKLYFKKSEDIFNIKINSFSDALEKNEFVNFLKNVTKEKLPEIFALCNYLDKKASKDSPFTFVRIEEVLEFINENSSKTIKKPALVLSTLLSIGNLTKFLQARYHIFVRSLDGVYYCEECNLISKSKLCKKCEGSQKQLKFCSNCHTIFKVEEEESLDNIIEVYTSFHSNEIIEDCPSCGKTLTQAKVNDGGVYYPQLAAFLLSVLSRISKSKKVLIFSDGRQLAEKIGSDFLNTDYTLQAQREITKFLLGKNGHKASVWKVRRHLTDWINETFLEKIVDNRRYIEREIDNHFRDLKKNTVISELNNIRKFTMLFRSGILTSNDIIYSNDLDNEEKAIAHRILLLMLSSGKFTLSSADVKGLTVSKVVDRLNIPNKNTELTKNKIKNGIKCLINSGIFLIYPKNTINTARERASDKNKFDEFLELEKQLLEQTLDRKLERNESSVFNIAFMVKGPEGDFDLAIANESSLCTNCKTGFPVSIETCLLCGDNTINGKRLDDGILHHEKLDEHFYFDHWGSQFLSPYLIENNEFGYLRKEILVGVHRGGLPPSLRAAYEEGFARNPPKVNIISSTTTFELGVDIGDLDVVMQIGLPPTPSNYIQRSGRVGRSRGRPSFVFTLIRNSHSIDDYFFDNLDIYFDKLPPINIPSYKNLEYVKAAHTITLVMMYLARNPDPQNIYKRIWIENSRNSNLQFILNNIKTRIKVLKGLIKRKEDELTKIVEDVLGSSFLQTFERVCLKNNDDLYFINRINKYINFYPRNSLTGKTLDRFIDSNRLLSQIMANVSYLAAFRGMREMIPILNRKKHKIEDKEIDRAALEAYPGEKNRKGGCFKVHMVNYSVENVQASSRKLCEIDICTNDDCQLYRGINLSGKTCPSCGKKLTTKNVHEPNKIVVRSESPIFGYKTIPEMIKSVALTKEEKRKSFKFNNIDISIIKGKVNVVSTVLRFYHRYRSSKEYRMSLSEAELCEISDQESNNIDDDLNMLLGQLEENQVKYVPIGSLLKTVGCIIRIQYENILLDNKADTKIINTFLATFEQLLNKATSSILNSDTNDFSVGYRLNEDGKVEFFIFDNVNDGNGLSDLFYENVVAVFENAIKIAKCGHCDSYCTKCVLSPETPEIYVKNQLLDRKIPLKLLNIS